VCAERYETQINGTFRNNLHFSKRAIAALTEPIDVYSEWIDKCEELNFPKANVERRTASRNVIPDANDEDSEDDAGELD